MSKPFLSKVVVERSVTVRTLDAASSVVVDQGAVTNTVSIQTNSTAKGILLQNDANAAMQLLGGDAFLFVPGGNLVETGSEIVENASALHRQTMLTSTNRVTLDPAAATYTELSNLDVGGLNVSSRLNIVPNATGTTIDSMIIDSGNPNPDGRAIWIQNTGTAAAQTMTLPHLSGSGTAGGQFVCPDDADYVIQRGGGASIMFDDSIGPSGAWLVRAIATVATASFQAFGYAVTGAEPDPSAITVTMPAAMPSSLYEVLATCQAVSAVVGFSITNKTTTTFKMNTTGALVAGDVIGFITSGVSAGSTTTLSVAISDSADPVITHVNFTYSVIVTNTGSATASGVSAVVTLDASLTYVSATGTGWSASAVGQVVTLFSASVPVGVAPTITVTVTSGNAATTATTTADASAANAPSAPQDSENTTVNLVTFDATSGIRVPASAAEWASMLAYVGIASGGPSALYLCQEASGNLADSIGAFTQTVGVGVPAITYQNVIAGWSRLGIGPSADASTGSAFNASASLPDVSVASMLTISYAILQATPGATRRLDSSGTPTRSIFVINTTPRVVATSGANTTTGASDPSGAVRPWVNKVNRTANVNVFYTNQEKLAPAIGAITGKQLQVIGGGTTCPQFKLLYSAAFFNAAAELSDAQVKALLIGLGWSIPWT